MASAIFLDPIYSGDTPPLPLTFTNPDGTPYNLTGITVGCTVKDDPAEPDSEALFKQDIAGDATGKVTFYLGPFPVGIMYMDVKWWNANQNNTRQTVIGTTEFVVHQSVTSRNLPGTTLREKVNA